MIINYTMTLEDYLIHNLYVASKSENITKRRQRAKIAFPLLYAAVGSFFLFQKNIPTAITFLGLSVLWYLLYPIWEKNYYLKQYTTMVIERFEANFGKPYSIEFFQDHLFSVGEGSESKLKYSELEGFAELPNTFLIQVAGGKAFILGKERFSNHDELRSTLKNLSYRLQIPYIEDNNWSWK